ncbi:MAG TPA: hypothetical protein VHP34_09480, partial [Alphaproteobacteria bacterium]|nr:hypothetical protein [Alphaproteobacteria bacterium]
AKSLARQLSAMTGRDVKFLDTDSARERTEKHAKIRIIFEYGTDQNNFFKWNYLPYLKDESVNLVPRIIDVERHLWGAIPYTPDARSQVEGYLIANNANEIEFAVCKIFPVMGEALLRALVTECLGRAMGVQNIVDQPDSIFGLWNKHFDRVSQIVTKDGWGKRSITFHHGAFPEEIEEEEGKPPQDFSGFDKKLVTLLYCNAIEAGMSGDDVREVMHTNVCTK